MTALKQGKKSLFYFIFHSIENCVLSEKIYIHFQVEWTVLPVHSHDLVKIYSNGTLVFHPFAVEKYRHEIHASVYRYDKIKIMQISSPPSDATAREMLLLSEHLQHFT